MRSHLKSAPTVDILGVPIAAVDMKRAVGIIGDWITRRESRYVCAADVYNVMLAQRNNDHLAALREADIVFPDGTPLVWVARLRGNRAMRRVCGPDLFSAVCQASPAAGWTHFLVGGGPGVADKLANAMESQHPGLAVVGTYCPPFRTLTAAESQHMLDRIAEAKPDIVWVGLGCPKQERWMLQNAPLIKNSVLIGVGAAFNFHTGTVKRAPLWMQANGLEWLHRFISEPRRLWRRYLIDAPRFVFSSLWETVVLRLRTAHGD